MKRGLILVEGQTEERFVKDVLAPEFYPRDFYLVPTLLVTKRVKHDADFKGGVTTYQKFRKDVERLLHSNVSVVTTLLDYYALPSDFPGMKTRPAKSPRDRVLHVEQSIKHDLGSPSNFVPFLALHELEAWLFASPEELPRTMTQPKKQQAFQAICESVATPEEIDEGATTAPSKRILALFP
ncbi:MAG TPA: DUF4276 family protein, partial [Thermoanaerobaculia bacterium]|nr:DUF4276 family protein [Thermoanaerobaculia bacterium]